MSRADLLNSRQMAERLGMGWEAFRKGRWRMYPHTFVGMGRDLRSARFLWYEDCSHLRIEGGDVHISVHESREEGLQGGIRVPGDAPHEGRIQDARRRQRLGVHRKEKVKIRGEESAAASDLGIDVFRRILKVPCGLSGQDAAGHI